jgi:hypothetical protein
MDDLPTAVEALSAVLRLVGLAVTSVMVMVKARCCWLGRQHRWLLLLQLLLRVEQERG